MGASSFLAAGAAGLSIAGGISEGIGKKTAAQIETVRLKTAAEAGKVRALQTDAAYREELNDVQNTMTAIRSSQNVGFDSATSFALFDAAQEKNRRARVVAVSNERLKALGLEGDAAAAWARGQQARTTSMLAASASALNSLSKVSFS
jgi:hypothetical protein